ncbi:HdeD family acid-resistance protein [Leucobacter sp. BZR 635]
MSVTDTTEPTLEARATDGARVLFGVGGLIAIVLGLFVIFAPKTTAGVTLTFLAALIGAYAIVTGIVYFGTAIFSRGVGGWSRVGHILLGILYIVGGVIIMSNLMFAGVVTALMFSIMVGMLWIFEGILAFATASKSQSKVWSIIYGIISLIAGVVLLLSPMMGAVTLWWLLGISMVVLGVVQVVRAFRVGK